MLHNAGNARLLRLIEVSATFPHSPQTPNAPHISLTSHASPV